MKKSSEYNRKWRERHPEQYKEISRKAHQKRYADPIKRQKVIDRHRAVHREVQRICTELKTITPCTDCGMLDKPYLMDFDHTEGTNNRSPANTRSVPELKRELKKVDIVCVRCHRIRTYERRQNVTKT